MPAELRQDLSADCTLHWVITGEKLYASAKLSLCAAVVHGRKRRGRIVIALTFYIGRYDFGSRSSVESSGIPSVSPSLPDDGRYPISLGVGAFWLIGHVRSLGAEGVEAWLARFISRDNGDATNKIRDAARSIAGLLGAEPEFKQLDRIIGTLLGTRRTRLTAPAAIARAAGKPYDDARLTLLGRAARFGRWVNMTSKTTAFADLRRSKAMGRPETDKLVFDDSIVSTPFTR